LGGVACVLDWETVKPPPKCEGPQERRGRKVLRKKQVGSELGKRTNNYIGSIKKNKGGVPQRKNKKKAITTHTKEPRD